MAAARPLLARAHRHPALALALVALVATGCGHRSGRAVFRDRCAQCHTLTGRDTGASGGDLARGLLDERAVESFTRVMPVRPRLSAADVRAVAAYVESIAQRVRQERRPAGSTP